MRSTSNPAFRNLPTQQGGHATFDRSGGGMMGGGAAYAGAQTSHVDPSQASQEVGRPITIDDIVQKTAISAGLALVAGVLTLMSGMAILALPAFIVGIVVALIVIFKQKPSAPLTLTYSAAMGVALGGISIGFNNLYPGIALQAVIGTAGVFFGMLVVYKTGAVKVTPRFTKWIMGAMIGVLVLMVANLVGSFFVEGGLGLRDGGPLAIIFSLVVIGVAAFSLLMDFDAADNAVRAGVPEKYSWYIAFGLMTTLVWLYIEILRLLSYFQNN
ncbi:Bax inhibitor-1/YccA family protein [Pseudonocardia parietis]|uniref:YccA/Bax inhibitor family protein n=1 Tax=Pseudonocardia parietis TaxID=570936 RepID=A0ABS4W3Y6_9PSEU|nr:Bax inhibitor-1/YccA family protein [Pseudonocardia parietis]MBP2370904.1 putative YccA/Bax inhibitor family protein [Pseudonocardia parietis]